MHTEYLCRYLVSIHPFILYESSWREQTLCVYCSAFLHSRERGECKKLPNVLNYYLFDLVHCLQLFISCMTYWQYYLSIWFFKWYNVFLVFWISLKWETENSHTYAWPIWWWWFILLCKETVEMFWKGWSCIGIQNTGVKQIQYSYSFCLEL